MTRSRIITALAGVAAAGASMLVGIPAASAHVICDDGHDHYRRLHRQVIFHKVDSVQLVNKSSTSAKLSADVGESHTSTRSFGGSITTSVEAGFWVFAKASASATYHVDIESSTTMSKHYTAEASVPPHSTRTVDFGFRKVNQYVQSYYLVNTSATTCGVHVLRQGWVDAPYQKAFIVKG